MAWFLTAAAASAPAAAPSLHPCAAARAQTAHVGTPAAACAAGAPPALLPIAAPRPGTRHPAGEPMAGYRKGQRQGWPVSCRHKLLLSVCAPATELPTGQNPVVTALAPLLWSPCVAVVALAKGHCGLLLQCSACASCVLPKLQLWPQQLELQASSAQLH